MMKINAKMLTMTTTTAAAINVGMPPPPALEEVAAAVEPAAPGGILLSDAMCIFIGLVVGAGFVVGLLDVRVVVFGAMSEKRERDRENKPAKNMTREHPMRFTSYRGVRM